MLMPDLSIAARLKQARIAANFETASAAADAMGVPVASYTQHENGSRGFKRDRAEKYARRFRTSVEWLIFGRGAAALPDPDPTEVELEQMLREAIDAVVTFDTKISELPRIVAPILRAQLVLFRADRANLDHLNHQPLSGKVVLLRPPTTPE